MTMHDTNVHFSLMDATKTARLWNSLFIRHLKICVNDTNTYLLNGDGNRESVMFAFLLLLR